MEAWNLWDGLQCLSAFDTYFLPVAFVGRGDRVRLLERCGGSLLDEEVGEGLSPKWKPHSSSFQWETVISLGLLNSTSSLMPGEYSAYTNCIFLKGGGGMESGTVTLFSK